MTTRTVKHQKNGTALLDEPIIHEPIIEELVPETQPDDAALVEVEVGERASNNQQGTQQFVTFMAGNEVFAADMSPVKEIIRVPEVVRVPLAPSALEGLARFCLLFRCAGSSAFPSSNTTTRPAPWLWTSVSRWVLWSTAYRA
jgi:hypothetical protein